MPNTKPSALLLVFKEIGPADLLKLQGMSNVTQSGGGARDLRLPWRTFRPVMEDLFTHSDVGKRGKPIRFANVTYTTPSGSLAHTRLEYWYPTATRPSEDRVARVHASPALGGRLPRDDKGRVFLLIIKWDNGEVRCYYAYEDELRGGKWAPEVRSAILGCMEDTDTKNLRRTGNKVSVQGHYDFTSGVSFCHAR